MCGNLDGKNIADVSTAVRSLLAEGWKSSVSTFYQHQQQGKIRHQADGTYTLASLKKYAKAFLRRRDNATLLKEALERELNKRMAFFRNDLETFCMARSAEIVTLVGGDPGKVSDLADYLLDHTEDCIESYSKEREFVATPM